MANDIENKKDVFMSGSKEKTLFMLDYLKNNLSISDADYWNYIGYYVISVPEEAYEYALREGRKFACLEDFGIYWINHYNERRGPIGSVDIAYGLFPTILTPTDKYRFKYRGSWDIDESRMPRDIFNYFEMMRRYLKVDRLFKTYNHSDDALTLSPLTEDYDTSSKLLKEFVERYGTGPFEVIHPLSYTGELVEDETLTLKRK